MISFLNPAPKPFPIVSYVSASQQGGKGNTEGQKSPINQERLYSSLENWLGRNCDFCQMMRWALPLNITLRGTGTWKHLSKDTGKAQHIKHRKQGWKIWWNPPSIGRLMACLPYSTFPLVQWYTISHFNEALQCAKEMSWEASSLIKTHCQS